jgi:hypothetical protein
MQEDFRDQIDEIHGQNILHDVFDAPIDFLRIHD